MRAVEFGPLDRASTIGRTYALCNSRFPRPSYFEEARRTVPRTEETMLPLPGKNACAREVYS
jgi:hypothetical protein